MGHEEEVNGSVKVIVGPPEPTLLPSKGVGVFVQDGALRFFVLSQFNNSDTTVRTPVSFKNAMKLLWNVWKERNANTNEPKPA